VSNSQEPQSTRHSELIVRHLSRRDVWIIDITSRSLATCERNTHAQMKRGLVVLATVASTAPLIGFLGTIIGIVDGAFPACGASKATCMAAEVNGVAEALLSTAIGMCVAVPALWAYNYFSSTLNAIDLETANTSLELTNYLTIELGRRRHTL
jgi:biopolymer transport protein ExbB/TolQ